MSKHPITTRLFSPRERPQPSRPLTPRKIEACVVMTSGPLDHTPDGWVSRAGVEHEPFNSHTIKYLALHGYCSAGERSASIMPRGERVAQQLEELVA